MKWHQIIENDDKAKEVSVLCNLIYAAEDTWIETNTDYITIDPYNNIVYIPESIGSSENIIELLNEKYAEKNIRFTIGDSGYHYKDVYVLVKEKFINNFHMLVKKLVSNSLNNKREYALIILRDGELVLLEGEEERITLPEIPSCVFLHTHPGPWCFPSKKDIQQTASFFMNGGVLNAIASEKCLFTFTRTWLLGEDDILALKELENKINKVYKEKNDPLWGIKEVLKNTVIETSIMFL